MSYRPDMELACRAARAGGAVVAAAFRDGPRSVTHKGAVDLVTEVDVASEHAIRAVLAAESDLPVLGEERGGAGAARTRWVVDPLDGTTNFVHGFPVFAVSVGLEVDGQPVVGAIFDPVRGHLFHGARDHGAWCEGQRLTVSHTATLGDALVATGFPYDRRQHAAFYVEHLRRVLVRCRCVRRAGAAAMDLAWTASGRLDAFFEFHLRRWDVCAGIVIVEEAGGRVTGFDGGAWWGLPPGAPPPADERSPLEDVNFVVSNRRVHDELLAVLADQGSAAPDSRHAATPIPR